MTFVVKIVICGGIAALFLLSIFVFATRKTGGKTQGVLFDAARSLFSKSTTASSPLTSLVQTVAAKEVLGVAREVSTASNGDTRDLDEFASHLRSVAADLIDRIFTGRTTEDLKHSLLN